MDIWSSKQLSIMSFGGNQDLEEFFEYYVIVDMDIRDKYRTKAAYYYRELLRSKVEGRVLDKEKPGLEDGSVVVEEEKKIMPVKNSEKKENNHIKNIVEGAFLKTKGFGRTVQEKVKDISIKDFENKAKIAYNMFENQVESWNIKEKLSDVREKTGNYYNNLTETAKNAIQNYMNLKAYENDKLVEGENELMLDPQGKNKAKLKKNKH